MGKISLKLGILRQQAGITQQKLADDIGVAFQTVSKWENQVTMPDITMLPVLSDYFRVTVDELLGLKPLAGEAYVKSESAQRGYWDSRISYLKKTRPDLWNEDYAGFLVKEVWRITKPIRVLDCGCGFGALGLLLLPLLPAGSTYTGVDFSGALIAEGRELFREAGLQGTLLECDVYEMEETKKYDLVICQAVLRHMENPERFLRKMTAMAVSGGLVSCVDVNRELESVGLSIDGMEYAFLCRHQGFEAMWEKELKMQQRDYAVAVKLPHMMRRLGLQEIGVRMNDKVLYLTPVMDGYEAAVQAFAESGGWTERDTPEKREQRIDYFVNHGMDRREAEAYLFQQSKIGEFISKHEDCLELTFFRGMMIVFGYKR